MFRVIAGQRQIAVRTRSLEFRRQVAFGVSLLLVLCLTACMSHRDAEQFNQELAKALATPFNALATRLSGGEDLAYATAAYRRKNARWPNDYAELTNFVAKSDGYLVLQQYQQVNFTQETNGAIHVAFLALGKKNEVSITLQPSSGNEPSR